MAGVLLNMVTSSILADTFLAARRLNDRVQERDLQRLGDFHARKAARSARLSVRGRTLSGNPGGGGELDEGDGRILRLLIVGAEPGPGDGGGRAVAKCVSSFFASSFDAEVDGDDGDPGEADDQSPATT
ncbi:hypothetical protein CCMA1212_005229 [Trichoderma ghanense]|uniref:CNNM transmembrane domain-containing protein n=1 Tax=Trichoderma ghanense TaxID=65468 RepID=A0ABY2H534_9HYPO